MFQPGVVVYACNPSYTGDIGRRMEVQGQPQAKSLRPYQKRTKVDRCRCLTPVSLATQEAKIKRITVQSQYGRIVHKTLSQKTLHKN
jgi:hypothetical protein